MEEITVQDINAQIQELHDQNEYSKIANLINKYILVFTDEPEFLWRAARSHYDMSDFSMDSDSKKDLLFKAHNLANIALSKNNDPKGDCHKWFAITLSALGDYVTTGDKIKNSITIQNHLATAIQLNPNDATTEHVLGRVCYAIASITWIERKIAATFIASPPTSSYDEALKHFLKSEEISVAKSDAPLMKNTMYIGHSYYKLKKNILILRYGFKKLQK